MISPVPTKEREFGVEIFPQRKLLAYMTSLGNSTWHLNRRNYTPIVPRNRKTLFSSLYEANVTLKANWAKTLLTKKTQDQYSTWITWEKILLNYYQSNPEIHKKDD
jgi:hypothetical protein